MHWKPLMPTIPGSDFVLSPGCYITMVYIGIANGTNSSVHKIGVSATKVTGTIESEGATLVEFLFCSETKGANMCYH